ncbi:MAG: GGDEF domain-containing protein [Desulfarculus sp.]|nr:GGDEF domain-containing protein [Pseudomonadota bacterium]MBV1718165.1 GGDEF domain-containing protein [Desulfarculus sp.]MBU4576347.1 GGDEF domain-containing protein [Pseudomonadota bacterium]MBU4598659.1 GGDEF domain-containing protein [Pseudomonadota bacterium]MBV1738773.1 GGDEF domain-containing protein [Desulfarculus sp.]
MIDRGRKSNSRLMIQDQKDVTRTIIKVALISLVASWLITGVVMLLVGGLTTSTLVVAGLASTVAPLAVAIPVAGRNLRLTLELNRSHQAIERLSRTDDLTQTYNRRYFTEVAQRELALAARHGHLVSLLLIDLDGFKQINDQLGHQVGDKALVACAQAIRHTIRQEDVVGRFGGDEFLVLAPHSDLKSAALLAQRVHDALDAANLVLGGQVVAIKASIGAVTSNGDAQDVDQILREADQALYRAKKMGGNRTELAA